jgi:DNA mismatch repair protein MutL
MPKIKQLSAHEAQKIAAGEVVERPANIVKELIENSLDAHATSISLYVKDGGKELIRVVDNGSGMDLDDAQLCFNKHATSKITHVDELETINTFGFRGEALASISAVGKVTLITKTDDTLEGNKLSVEQNSINNIEAVSATTGTDIAIQDLFYNIPARKKFLKTRDTEWRHILQLMHAFCLDYPNIHFKLFSEDKIVLNCPPTDDLATRFTQIWDNHNNKEMLSVKAERSDGTVAIAGTISNHQQFRYDRNGIFFFVNNRWIKDYKLTNALIKGYQNVIPHGKYPMAAIMITIDPKLVDINIHPRKEEVRFLHPRMVETLIKDTVKQELEQNISAHISPESFGRATSAPTTHIPSPASKTFTPFDFDSVPFMQEDEDSAPPSVQERPAFDPTSVVHTSPIIPHTPPTGNQHTTINNHTVQKTATPEAITHEKEQVSIPKELSFQIIGQYKKTYILIEQEDGLYLVDQHAAHERVLYELFSQRFDDVATIRLIFPQIIPVSQQELELFEPHLNLFHTNGIMIEPFGDNQLIVQSTPAHLKNASIQELVKQVIGWIYEQQNADEKDFFKAVNEKLHAQMACKAAVKAGDVLTMQQMQQILKDLHNSANRFACPHGRPTGWLLSVPEIEKKFKRRL